MQHLINELKRRNVFRATAAYSVVAWVIGQVADLVLPAFEAPPWVLKTVIGLLVIGLPLVMVLAWIYELTPHGLRRTAEDDSPEVHTEGSRMIDSIIILALVAAVLAITAIPDNWTDDLSQHTGKFGRDETARGTPRVIVLPTVNVSIDSESSLLSSGFSRLLREELQLNPHVQTLGRATSSVVREKNIPAPVIADKYHVNYIVQTSLRTNEAQIVVDLQLIDAREGKEVWSKTFSDKTDNIKGVFANSLREVRRQLKLEESEFAGNQLNGPAFGLWLRVSRTPSDDPAELADEKSAAIRILELDPDFGPARIEAARLTLEATGLPGGGAADESFTEVRTMLEKSLGSSPAAPQVQQLRPDIESRLSVWRARDLDFERISAQFREALANFPFDPDLHTAFAHHLYRWGEFVKAAEQANKALRLDPLSADLYTLAVKALVGAGKTDEAEGMLAEVPDEIAGPAINRLSGLVALARGELDRATRQLNEGEGDWQTLQELIRIDLSRGNRDRAATWLATRSDTGRPAQAVWKAAVEGGVEAAFDRARELMVSPAPRDAALLGRLAVQNDDPESAVTFFHLWFDDWLHDPGTLKGPLAWTSAPWYALALMETGKEDAAHRLLDRHLAGVIAAETDLSPPQRNLYLAANYAVRERDHDAISALEDVAASGFSLSWGILGTPVPLEEIKVFDRLPQDARFSQVIRMMSQASLPVEAASEQG